MAWSFIKNFPLYQTRTSLKEIIKKLLDGVQDYVTYVLNSR